MSSALSIADFTYQLPKQLIANQPASPRDQARLMVVDRLTGQLQHLHFSDLANLLTSNDVLVLNQTKVFPARLFGEKTSGGRVEILLLRQVDLRQWLAISRPGLKPGQQLSFPPTDSPQSNLSASDQLLTAQVLSKQADGDTILEFNLSGNDFLCHLDQLGSTPVPPYIQATQTEQELRKSYQTVYAKDFGSAAAPTAGLHFTQALLTKLKQQGVQLEYLDLHVGLGTFQPLREEQLQANQLHEEYFEITPEVAARLNQARKQGKRIIAVGTTTLRALESACQEEQTATAVAKKQHDQALLKAQKSATRLFIKPGDKLRFVDSLITNFHLPHSSLLMLVTALVSAPNTTVEFKSFASSLIGQAYQEAIHQNYRFYSFGDAMWIKSGVTLL